MLEQNRKFLFDDACLEAFIQLKTQLVNAPIVIAPDWSQPFEVMCNASDFAVGAYFTPFIMLAELLQRHNSIIPPQRKNYWL